MYLNKEKRGEMKGRRLVQVESDKFSVRIAPDIRHLQGKSPSQGGTSGSRLRDDCSLNVSYYRKSVQVTENSVKALTTGTPSLMNT